MLMLLTPSKTMSFSKPPLAIPTQQPIFYAQAVELAGALKKLSASEIKSLMRVSDALAASTAERYRRWGTAGNDVTPALYAYVGDVYKGLRARSFDESDVQWAEERLRILSGIYGLLRPGDLVEPYRLEMKAALQVGKSKDLYEYWLPLLPRYLEENCSGLVFNLSSDEYAKAAIQSLSNDVKVVTPIFVDTNAKGEELSVPIYSKIMRGVVAHWMIKNRVDSPEGIKYFNELEYTYSPERTKHPDQPVFFRATPSPIRPV